MRGKTGEEGAYQIPIAFICEEFNSKSTSITSSISGSLFAANSRKADENRRLLAYLAEEIGTTQVGNIICNFEYTVGTGTFGVDDSVY